jgi:hypothetical protein
MHSKRYGLKGEEIGAALQLLMDWQVEAAEEDLRPERALQYMDTEFVVL